MAFVLIIFIVAGSIGAVVILSKKNSLSPIAHAILSKKNSLPLTAYAIQIVNGTANVDAGTFFDYPFTIPSNSSNIHVSGAFTVEGGSGTGLIVYIFDNTNFDTYENGGDFGGLYQSGQTTAASISSNLDTSGIYYLVLDNTLSPINQTVNIQANVTYLAP